MFLGVKMILIHIQDPNQQLELVHVHQFPGKSRICYFLFGKYSKRLNNKNNRKSPVRQSIPTPRELAMQADAISNEGYKWEKYR